VRSRSTPRAPSIVAMFAVALTVAAGGLGAAVSSAGAATKPKSPRPIATAPFTAPTDVTLADTPPPWALPVDARPFVAAAGLTVLGSEQLAVHYHSHLDIVANGAKVTVPAGIGFVVSRGKVTGLTVLHVHDTSGIIHVESATHEPFTLGQVFIEWGVALSATQLGGLHSDGAHVLAAFVNGRRFRGDPATLRLKPHAEIALWYGPSGETPHVPSSYHFTGGL
jgi:hypothetical protein